MHQPRPILDILSTPPPYHQPVFDSPSTTSNSNQSYTLGELSGGRGGSFGAKGDPWTAGPGSSSPPSPSTIDSYPDSQGECFPSGSDSSEILEAFNRARALSQPTAFRRNNLSLSINNLPSFPGTEVSPSTLASSSAPFTDSLTYGYANPYEYFQFEQPTADEPIPSVAPPLPTSQANAQYGYRLPASQPTSPVRTLFPPGQAPFNAQAGRQRGATFSGTYSVFAGQVGTLPVAQPVGLLPSAIPAHLAFSQIQQSPSHSPLLASPVIHSSPAQQSSYFEATPVPSQPQVALPTQEVLMADLATPTQGLPGVPLPQVRPPSRRSSFSTPGGSSADILRTGEDLEKLKLVEDILNSANEARAAILRGEDAAFSANVGQINHLNSQLVTADMGPSAHPQTASPATYQASPVQAGSRPITAMSNAHPGYQHPQMLHQPMLQSPMQMPAGMQQMMPVQMMPMQQMVQPTPHPAHHSMPLQMQLPPLQSQPNAMQVPAMQLPPMQNQPMQTQPMQSQLPMTAQQPALQLPTMAQPTLTLQQPVPTHAQLPMINTAVGDSFVKVEPASATYTSETTLVPPPMVHSHSFPNGHQLPSQLHAPSTPVIPSPSFAAALGIGHPPHISSPLATMPMSRPPSPRMYRQPDMQPVQFGESSMRGASELQPRRPSADRAVSDSRADGRPVNRGRSTSMTKGPRLSGMTSSVPPSAWHSRAASPEDDEDDDSEDEAPRKMKRRRSSAGNAIAVEANAVLSEDMRRQLDRIFEEFLCRVCSDLEMTDTKGEKLHQVLMPKKMQRMEESADFRPFKLRIQAFTNKFTDELVSRGITEETMSAKRIRTYLWNQPLISRFNADGKKAKSKGNHIWNIMAKRMTDGTEPAWLFKPFKRQIQGDPRPFAVLNQRWEFEPRIWDPQAAAETIHPSFSSPEGNLPDWLRWEGGKLGGVPTQLEDQKDIIVVASFTDVEGHNQSLSTTFKLSVVLPALLPMAQDSMVYQQPAYPWPNDYDYSGMDVPPHLLSQPIVPYHQAVSLFTGQTLPPGSYTIGPDGTVTTLQ